MVLFLHGPRNIGGDSVVMLRTVERLDRARVRALVVATPDCEGWERWSQLAARVPFTLLPLDMGVTGTDPDSPRHSRVRRVTVVASALAGLVRIIRREQVDLLYTLDRSRSPLLAALAARLSGRPFVFHAHYPYYPSARWSVAVVRAADRVVAISDFIRREYEQRGIDRRRIVTIYNGVDAEVAPSDPAATRARLNLAGDEQVVLMPGRLSRYKGQLELVEAMPRVLEAFPRTRFVFAGYDSPELGDLSIPGCGTVGAVLRKRAAELGVTDQALFLGETGEMNALYAIADVVAAPSWAEPFGLVVAEAMAAVRPLVAAAAGAIPEIVVDGETGLLVPPRAPEPLAEALIQLLGDPAAREKMGQAGRARVQACFTLERYAREMQDLFVHIAT
jgi:glycosyltransferase involved in cell wall biosynthesis